MVPRTIRSVTTAIIFVCIGVATQASAQTQKPEEFLQNLADDAIHVLSDSQLSESERQSAFRGLLRRGFDMPTVGRFVLGRYWRGASAEQRDEFLGLFEDYIVGIYGQRLGNYSSDVFAIDGHRMVQDGSAIVATSIRPAESVTVAVGWRLRRDGDNWRIIDIMVEGVSLAVAQRSEFAAVIRSTGGLDGLLGKLRQKTAHLREQRVASQEGRES